MHHDGNAQAWQAEEDLTFATCQADNTVPVSRALAAYLGRRLAQPVRFLEACDWRDAYDGISRGTISLGWICGWPYVRLAGNAPLSLLVAPVMAGARYGDRPVYYSDVIVRAGDRARTFADLRGRHWVHNEPGSQSGYHIMRHHLATLGETVAYFGRTSASGGHVNSIEAVLDGRADTSAIDSTVLEWEMERRPQLAEALRIVAVLGPSPIPPIVISARVPEPILEAIRTEMLALDRTEEGRAILAEGRLSRFAPVIDADYDPIRRMEARARAVEGQAPR
jgi:phosphonate transport system substrate-binding protein